jgi:hypothetical protein
MTLYPVLLQNDPQISFWSATFDTKPNRTGLLVGEVASCLALLRELRYSCVRITPPVLRAQLPSTLHNLKS